MKLIGLICIMLGISLLLIVIFTLFNRTTQVMSPIPEEKGVKVILLTPSK